MADIPTTSTTLLRDIAEDPANARGAEFAARYRPMMEAFMRERFPSVDADDVIQETLIALIKAFPVYHYSPEEKGHFRNYLTGILRNKALKSLRDERRQTEIVAELRGVPTRRDGRAASPLAAVDEQSWRESIFEIALQQLFADGAIADRTKQVFRRVAVNGEKPDDVAVSFGIERNAVDQMKARMMTRLRELVAALEKVYGDDGNGA